VGEGWNRFWFTPGDPAGVSAIRLLTGIVVVYLHASMLPDLVPLFGTKGLLPVAEIAPLEGASFSYLNYLSTPSELWTVHLIGLAVLVLFAAGLWTRVTTVLALVVLLSDIHRAAMLTARAEPIAAMLMFYLCFAPCGRRYSLDRVLERRRRQAAQPPAETDEAPSTLATIATRLIQVHLALLIAMMGFSKLSSETWWSGAGVWYLVARPESRLVDLTWLYASPKVLDAWTHAIVLFELVFPVLIWVPLARPLLLAIAVPIWTSLALVTGELPFALMLMIASLAFVSPDLLRSCCQGATERPTGD
jgi:hypothetical protein